MAWLDRISFFFSIEFSIFAAFDEAREPCSNSLSFSLFQVQVSSLGGFNKSFGTTKCSLTSIPRASERSFWSEISLGPRPDWFYHTLCRQISIWWIIGSTEARNLLRGEAMTRLICVVFTAVSWIRKFNVSGFLLSLPIIRTSPVLGERLCNKKSSSYLLRELRMFILGSWWKGEAADGNKFVTSTRDRVWLQTLLGAFAVSSIRVRLDLIVSSLPRMRMRPLEIERGQSTSRLLQMSVICERRADLTGQRPRSL